jgi:sterol desaturase/sphingolipid hydroxylase (fatty acid hydroxylase superfamily)
VRHLRGFWVVFHQAPHSPARIEALTAFYKHPVEIDGQRAGGRRHIPAARKFARGRALVQFFCRGGRVLLSREHQYFIQTPELHSIHHQLDVHHYNHADLPLWDGLFGTYRDADTFAARCGFPRNNERQLGRMLLFRDVYKD